MWVVRGVGILDIKGLLREKAVVQTSDPREARLMLPTEDLFVHVYYIVDEAIRHNAIRILTRPGPNPPAPTPS